MDLSNDYDKDGNNIVPCPICLNVYCPIKEGGKCPEEDEYAKCMEFESQLVQAILGGLEHRGFYDCGKYLDQTLVENIRPLFNQQLQKERAHWLRSEIEKLESEKKPLTKSMYGTLHLTQKDFAYNQALTSIITRYKEELKVLETQI